ncbi:MAG: diaminopimelate epimerase [Gammaproteobacteria bacterium]|nr:diaminopimelate epimerase [Gammaproteobacteria bacterium]
MQFTYLKMQGAGNQIVVVDQREQNMSPPSAEELRQLGKGGTGLGFDQLMWVSPPRNEQAAASYRIFNNDGSEVEQCGNGVRCVAWMLAKSGGSQRTFVLESPAGLIEAVVTGPDHVSVSMGPPEFDPAKIPFVADKLADVYTLQVFGRAHTVSVLSMGNPHCVLRVDSIAAADVDRLGPAIERHERFPAEVNVGFMSVLDRKNIELRVYERGVGETLACGTGACAAVVAGQRLGLLDEEVAVRLPGGQLVVSWRGAAEPVWLTGNAELISEGSVDL